MSPCSPKPPSVLSSALRSAWWRPLCAVALGGLLATACDQEDAPVVESADLRADELDARCEFLVRCGFMPDRDTCFATQTHDDGLVQALGGISFDRTGYDPELAAVWIDTLRNLGCEATLENARLLAEARAPVFAGRLDEGGSCFADEECSEGLVCDRSMCPQQQLCCTGQCVEQQVLTVGQRCPLPQDGVRITAVCEELAYCQLPPDDGSGMPPTEGTCVARSDNGLPCDAVDGCLDGQRCDVNGSGNCYKLSASGEMCNPSLQQGSCLAYNEACSPASSQCEAAPQPGQPCVLGRCVGWAVCQEDTCVARLRAGEACDGSIPCLGDLRCQDGFCQLSSTLLVCIEGDPPPPPMM